MDGTLQQVLGRIVALLLIASVHGWALAFVAERLGDPGPRYDGRRTFDPFAHLDAVGALGIVIFGIGWIKPVAVDHAKLRFGPLGAFLLTLSGLGAVLALAVVTALLRNPLVTAAPGTLPLYGVVVLQAVSSLSVGFVLFNLVPVPPLTAAHVLRALSPAVGRVFDRYRLVFTGVVAAAVASGAAAWLMLPVYRPAARFVLGL